MQAITGERPALTPRLASLMTDPERATVLPNDLMAVQRFVVDRAGRGPASTRPGAAA
jgi:threonine synthase